MAKGNPDKVNPKMAEMAVSNANSRQAAYSQYVLIHYHATGRFACGFDNKDLQAWIDLNMPDVFDKKGKKIGIEQEN